MENLNDIAIAITGFFSVVGIFWGTIKVIKLNKVKPAVEETAEAIEAVKSLIETLKQAFEDKKLSTEEVAEIIEKAKPAYLESKEAIEAIEETGLFELFKKKK